MADGRLFATLNHPIHCMVIITKAMGCVDLPTVTPRSGCKSISVVLKQATPHSLSLLILPYAQLPLFTSHSRPHTRGLAGAQHAVAGRKLGQK